MNLITIDVVNINTDELTELDDAYNAFMGDPYYDDEDLD